MREMAPSIKKALGAVKDRTSIGLAKMSSAMSSELDVAIIKATSHDLAAADEKHLRLILGMTSYSRSYVPACVATVWRRLSKTRDWVVALKALMLIHRLIVDGDPAFLREIMYATRRGGARLLDMAGFRDTAHADSWGHSAFVRNYALYLDQRLEFIVYEKKQNGAVRPNQSPRDNWRWTPPAYRYDPGEPDPYSSNVSHGRYWCSSPSGNGGASYDERGEGEKEKPATTLTGMKPERLLGRTHQLQQLFDRFLACRPTGNAKFCRLILVALYPIVRESFQLYSDVVEILSILLDRFFDMEYPQCAKSFEAYTRAAKQIDELCGFYAWCKDTGAARSLEYPRVQRITDQLLGNLEELMRDRDRKPRSPPRETPPTIVSRDEEEEPAQDVNSIRALPAPSDYTEEQPQQRVVEPAKPRQQYEGDLLDLRDNTASAEDHSNSPALAPFQGPLAVDTALGSWDAFPPEPPVTSEWQMPAAQPGSADWEIALMETARNLWKQKVALGGGFDQLLLNGMYDQAIVRGHGNAQIHGGSASSVDQPAPGRSATPVLALPADDGTVKAVGQDPFAASLGIPPTSYVQMADVQKEQQLLVQEQFMWQRYASEGMQGVASLSKLQTAFISSQQMQRPYAGVPTDYGTA